MLYAIIFHTPSEMKTYRMFLLNICVSDFLVAFGMTFIQPIPASSRKEIERPANDSGISYVIMGPIVYFVLPPINHIITCIFCGVLLYNILTLPYCFLYRYVSLIYIDGQRFLHKKTVFFAVIAIIALVCCSVSFFMVLGDMPKFPVPEIKDWSEYYTHKSDTEEVMFGNLIHMDFHVYYMIGIFAFCVVFGYALLTFCAVQIFRTLYARRNELSKRTLELQRKLALSLACQSSLPVIFVGIPIAIISTTIATNTYTKTINGVATVTFSYQVVFSPLITFIFVKPYRKVLHVRFWFQSKKIFNKVVLPTTSSNQRSVMVITGSFHR
ncbi:hypothetical protein QR680_000008 [Steinernema hermaphroditum]|uniref:G-protein coupled receptors family 1 profile domain-containing protein n=1 Tax=Steinernema hermaphroditum TaxID=289476 RepID=A0AA39LDH7_9BILA|nr:hypothetical protein QR680_000008 [Steinernema hermaphroditum]